LARRRAAARNRPVRAWTPFSKPFEILPFGSEAAEIYAEIRLQLEKVGRPIGERDLLIAVTAKSRRLTVVTHNVRER
jgi:tRNA(fMet)-specific endonuclease VapC